MINGDVMGMIEDEEVTMRYLSSSKIVCGMVRCQGGGLDWKQTIKMKDMIHCNDTIISKM